MKKFEEVEKQINQLLNENKELTVYKNKDKKEIIIVAKNFIPDKDLLMIIFEKDDEIQAEISEISKNVIEKGSFVELLESFKKDIEAKPLVNVFSSIFDAIKMDPGYM